MGVRARASVAIAVLAGSVVIAASEAAAAPSVTVTPSTGLVELDTVTVEGSGFDPFASVAVCQGFIVGSPDASDCAEAFTLDQASEDGSLETTYTVRRFVVFGGERIDCLDPDAGCVLGVAEVLDLEGAIRTPLSFTDPPPPPAVRGTIAVTPDEGLLDNSDVQVTGEGFRSGASVAILQCGPGPDDPTDCADSAVVVTAGPSGGFSSSFPVDGQITTRRGAFLDCESGPGACVLAAAELVDPPGTIVGAPLSFNRVQPDLQIKRRSDGVISGDDVYGSRAPGQVRGHSIAAGGRWTFALRLENDGNTRDDIRLVSFAGNNFVDVEFFFGFFNVTEFVTNGGFVFRLAPGEAHVFAVRFTASPETPPGEGLVDLSVTAFSDADVSRFDDVELSVRVPVP